MINKRGDKNMAKAKTPKQLEIKIKSLKKQLAKLESQKIRAVAASKKKKASKKKVAKKATKKRKAIKKKRI
jgi:hypothetical protein